MAVDLICVIEIFYVNYAHICTFLGLKPFDKHVCPRVTHSFSQSQVCPCLYFGLYNIAFHRKYYVIQNIFPYFKTICHSFTGH